MMKTRESSDSNLKIILIWAKGLLFDGPLDREFLKQIHDLVKNRVSFESISRSVLLKLSLEFPDSYQLVVPMSSVLESFDLSILSNIRSILLLKTASFYRGSKEELNTLIDKVVGILES